MVIIAVVVLLVLTGFLFVSAAAKAVYPRPATAALVELGLSGGVARNVVAACVATEAAVAAALVLWPQASLARGACVALFGAFALAAAIALRSSRKLECGCLGALHSSTLGWTQLLQFGAVVACLTVVGRFAPEWSLQTGAGLMLLVLAGAAALLLADASAVWLRIRRDRVSLGGARAYLREAGWTGAQALEGEGRPR